MLLTIEECLPVLITQRSQVQILPPLLFVQVRALFRFRERASCCGLLTRLLTGLSARRLLAPRLSRPLLLSSGDRRMAVGAYGLVGLAVGRFRACKCI